MQKTFFFPIFIFFFFVLQNSIACSCFGPENLKTEYSNTDIIVHAKVINMEFVTMSSTLSRNGLESIRSNYNEDRDKMDFLKKDWVIRIEMEILSVYKGNGFSEKIIVYTSRLSGACGYLGFEIGQEFQVYLSSKSYFDYRFKKAKLENKDYRGFWTNRCSRTKPFNDIEDKKLKTLMSN